MPLPKLSFAAAAALTLTACGGVTRSTVAPEPQVLPGPNTQTVGRQIDPPEAVVSSAAANRAESSDTARLTDTDINRRTVAIFGDTTVPVAAPDAGPSWDIDVRSYESTARVEHYVRLFTGSAKERIQARLSDGTRFESMIRAKMREGGLPEDLYYLALVESGFDPNAYSRAAAVGMWQFMASTGRDMGLRVDWWVDERRDPVKSTTAAVRFIKALNEQFGSLYLAAAAYNGGPGRIARGLSRYEDDFEGTSGDDLFFALAEKDYLKNETREYVPQLIAAALIAKEPDRYGITITPKPPFEFDSVRVGPGTPVLAIAQALGAPTATLMDLNPQILRGMTPPKDSTFVRVPVGGAAGFDSAFASLPANSRTGFKTIKSKKGESVASIAKREGLTSKQLSAFNPKLKRLKSGNLVVGQSVLVPAAAAAAAAVSVPDPSIERYSSATTTHVVKSGETLSHLAVRYHTTVAALMRNNGLRKPMIFAGQTIVVRGTAPKASVKKAPAKKPIKK